MAAARRGGARIVDVARLSKFSVATVSRALNPATASAVSADTRHAVEAAAEELGYIPNDAARTLRTSSSLVVGVVVPDIANPIFPPIVRGIDDQLRTRNYSSLLANSDGDPARAEDAVQRMLRRGVDGLIIATSRLEDQGPTELVGKGVPVVLANRHTSDTAIASVTSTSSRGTYDSLAALVELGHRNIVVVAAPQNTSTGRERLRSAQCAAEDLLGAPLPVILATEVSEREGHRLMSELLDGESDATAVLAANDMMALGCIRAARERGMRCPDDISIVGFNDMRFADVTDPPLSTIKFDQYEMGVQSGRLVLDLIAGAPTAPSVEIPTTWLPRGSTGPVSQVRRS